MAHRPPTGRLGGAAGREGGGGKCLSFENNWPKSGLLSNPTWVPRNYTRNHGSNKSPGNNLRNLPRSGTFLSPEEAHSSRKHDWRVVIDLAQMQTMESHDVEKDKVISILNY